MESAVITFTPRKGDAVSCAVVSPQGRVLAVSASLADLDPIALFRLSALDRTWASQPAGRVRFPALAPETAYLVTPVPLSVSPKDRPRPAWYHGGAVMSGRLLDELGLIAPFLEADDLVIVHLVAEVAS
jgi:hypothetical protein